MIQAKLPENVLSEFILCEGLLGGKRRAAESLLQHLRESGAEFYFVRPDRSLEHPEAEIEPTGDLSLVGVAHRILKPSSLDALRPTSPWLDGRGNAMLWFMAYARVASFSQSAFLKDGRRTNALVSAHRKFMQQLIPLLKPKFAWLDASGESVPSSKFVSRVEMKVIFWSMFFGPKFVEKYGRSFLTKAPVWRVDDFGPLGVMLTATKTYTDWLTGSDESLLKYFRRKIPGIKAYRYQPIP